MMKGEQMAVNNFRPRKYEDFEIVDASKNTVGHVRVKPSGLLWSRGGKHGYVGVTLAAFAKFMETHGKKQRK